MRTKFWSEKKDKEAKPLKRTKSTKEIDITKLTPSQKQMLAAALLGE